MPDQVCQEQFLQQVLQQALQQHGTSGHAGAASQGGSAGLMLELQSNVASRQQQAATDIQGLAISQSNRDAIIAAGAVPLLVALLRSDQPTMQKPAADALANLAVGAQQSKDAIIAAGAVPLLVALLRLDQSDQQSAAANTLANLAAGSQQNRDAIIAAGAVPLLDALCLSGEPDVQREAAWALQNLHVSSQQKTSCCSMM